MSFKGHSRVQMYELLVGTPDDSRCVTFGPYFSEEAAERFMTEQGEKRGTIFERVPNVKGMGAAERVGKYAIVPRGYRLRDWPSSRR